MGSPEKPIDVEMGDMSDETKKLNPEVEIKTEQGLIDGERKEERFTGLKKEELLAISNQPKWVRARWVLFIIFWIVWIAMLVGAILIVVKAPRCKPEPKPMWYQDTVVYEAKVDEFAENFAGMEKHLPYLEALKAKTILAVGAGKQTDPSLVVNDETEQLESLIKVAHEKQMKVLVDLVVDSLSTESDLFRESDSLSCTGTPPTGTNCDFFLWQRPGADSRGGDRWVCNNTRGECYKASASDANRALINYGSAGAMDYMLNLMASWFNRGIDGLQIRDVGQLQNMNGKSFVEGVWMKHFENQNDTRALFVYSSVPDASVNPVPITDLNQTNTIDSPMIINTEILSHAGHTGAGGMIEKSIQKWRSQTRNIGADMLSPLGGQLAAARFKPTLAAGMQLLSLALPGVPIIRSGDEVGVTSPSFDWANVKDIRESMPVNASKSMLDATKKAVVMRVEGIQAMQSLRYDTRNPDTTFAFLNLGNDEGKDVVAFKRKWATKAPVLVVSNLSPNNLTVNAMVTNGLMKDENLVKEAKVLVATPSFGAENVNLDAIKMDSGTTLIIGI